MNRAERNIKAVASRVLDLLLTYVDGSVAGKGKVLVQQYPKKMADQMGLESLLKNGELTEESTIALVEKYLENTQHMHHPGYIGHQVAVPHLFSALADMIHGFVNNPMAIYEMGPAPATMEKVVLNWMLDKIGWFHADTLHESDDKKIGGGGVLTHGGSLANLTALLAARAKADPNAWTEGLSVPLYVLAPEPTHYSIARAVSIMGMGAKNLVPIPLNEYEQIIPDKLDELLRTMQKEGKRVMAVVANACATSTGLYDPLDAVGDICQRYGVWYHIDGAHGAGALLTDKYKSWMKGCYKADSMIWDAHKMLRTPALSAAVLIKRHEDLANTFRQKGSYIFFEKEQIGYDFMHNTVECTKAPLGTKIFFALAAEGEQGIGDYIEDRYQKTHDFYSLIHSQEDFECPCEPQANILCFRYSGGDDSEAFQLELRNRLTAEGDFYITTTTIHGKRYLRLTVMNPLTDLFHIEALLDEIRLVAGGLVSG